MSVLSIEAAAFLFAAAIATRIVRRAAVPAVVLLASSIFFIAATPGGVLWLAFTVVLTYVVANRLSSAGSRWAPWLVAFTILLIVGALLAVKLPGGSVAAPLGVSYFSFRLIGYLLDVYWGRNPPARSPTTFAAFVTFFPQITSGPIDRWGHFLGHLERYEYPNDEQMASALRLILFGLFKKVVVANRLGFLVDAVFDSPNDIAAPVVVAAAYAFPIQLYADFSGLTDIARGASRLLGIEAPRNFDRPFLSSSVQEFWSRWHMSLTSWLGAYLFQPLSATLRRRGRVGLAVAISVNMLAVGLWHGLQWTFLVFGVINAIYMVPAALKKRRPGRQAAAPSPSWRRWLNVLLTFNLMTFAFVFFRAANLPAAFGVLGGFASLFHSAGEAGKVWPLLPATTKALLAPVVVMVLVELGVARGYWNRWFMRPKVGRLARWATYYATILAIIVFGVWDNTTFIYARF